MRTLPAGMQDHLDTGATTLAWCWRITRNDAVVLGFTDHDVSIEFDGTTYEADTGISASDVRDSVGLNVDNVDIQGAVRSQSITEDDLAAGLYDNATVELWRVNWSDTSQRVLMRKGSTGEIRRRENLFVAEIRGLAHEFNQPAGRTFQFQCDAILGDARCGIDLDDPDYKGTGAITSVDTPYRFAASGLTAFDTGWFTGGLLTWTSGDNNGRSVEVKFHEKDADDNVILELWQLMSKSVQTSDSFTITAGCNKLFTTCKDKFSNTVNFRGFPHMPGNTYVVSYPTSGEPGNDGGSMNN